MINHEFTAEDYKHLIELTRQSEHSGFIQDILLTTLKLIEDGINRGDLKIITTALKELRYSFKVFSPYRHVRKATIFGSARTPETNPEYILASEFSKKIAEAGWMVITGAASGIMKAGHEGAGRDKSFGVNIRLPFEQKANTFIENDPKLINYKYFFTRKLIFIKESDAVVLFPGGFGTHDEGFETLTLIQTGKCPPRPVVMIASEGNDYWNDWGEFIKKNLLKQELISAEDLHLYKITHSVKEAADELINFYKMYHSSRFVRDAFVIRLNSEISPENLKTLNHEFKSILDKGEITLSKASPEEANEPDLAEKPRLVFYFNRRNWGRLRVLINYLNSLPT